MVNLMDMVDRSTLERIRHEAEQRLHEQSENAGRAQMERRNQKRAARRLDMLRQRCLTRLVRRIGYQSEYERMVGHTKTGKIIRPIVNTGR